MPQRIAPTPRERDVMLRLLDSTWIGDYDRAGNSLLGTLDALFTLKDAKMKGPKVKVGMNSVDDAIKILLVDDQSLFRKSLRLMLRTQQGFDVVGEASDGLDAVEKARDLRPDVVLMDLDMPVCNGIEALRLLRGELPDIKVVMLTISEENEELFSAIRAGATGYLLKSMEPDELFRAIEHAFKGEAVISPLMAVRLFAEVAGDESSRRGGKETESVEPPLTAREKDILELMRRGCTNKQIAASLCIAEATVKTHLHNILDKLHMQNRAQLAAYAASSLSNEKHS